MPPGHGGSHGNQCRGEPAFQVSAIAGADHGAPAPVMTTAEVIAQRRRLKREAPHELTGTV